jgi:hypothetical protein
LLADSLAIKPSTVNGLHTGIDQIVKHCSDWNLQCNFKRIEILFVKKGGKLKNNEKSFMRNQLTDAVKEVSYLGVAIEVPGDATSIR